MSWSELDFGLMDTILVNAENEGMIAEELSALKVKECMNKLDDEELAIVKVFMRQLLDYIRQT